jgi:hypothetical protein
VDKGNDPGQAACLASTTIFMLIFTATLTKKIPRRCCWAQVEEQTLAHILLERPNSRQNWTHCSSGGKIMEIAQRLNLREFVQKLTSRKRPHLV